jgi:drug/metabolite transporter (DMT)-like permease
MTSSSTEMLQTAADAMRARLFILLSAFLWSLAGVFIKFLDVHPLVIVFYRSLFASFLFMPFLRRRDFTWGLPVLISFITYTAAITAFVSANKLTTAANAIVLQYTAPIFVFLFSHFALGENISRLNGIALAIAMCGVAIISFDSAGQPQMVGVLLALLSGVLFAGYMINLRNMREISPVYLTWINNLFCALLLLPFVSSRLSLGTQELWVLALMGGVQLGLPYFFFSKGLRSISLQEASLIALVEPVLNPIWVALMVGEIPALATITGGAMILVGLTVRYIWPLLSQSRAPRSELTLR